MSSDPGTSEMSVFTGPPPNRRDDIEIKHAAVARLLDHSGSEGLLVLEPANFSWLTSGAVPRGLIGSDETPALYFNSNQRWLLCSNVDTQRFFDEELDGLGFQVKEWPWQGNREQHLADICFNRRVVSDRPFRDCKLAGAFFEQERRRLSAYERERSRELGRMLAHALEATARNTDPDDTEEEVAGQLAHRLVKHGAAPTTLQVSADERARDLARPGVTSARIQRSCVIQATASRSGLFATASRSVCFGQPEVALKSEFDIASQIVAVWSATITAGHRAAALIETARHIIKGTPHEHDWRLSPPGWLTGRRASEGLLSAASTEGFTQGNLVVWRSRVGGGVSCDTYLLDNSEWKPVTIMEEWPVRRYVIQGKRFEVPDLLKLDTEQSQV
jgi:Xaa-Pro aminopeptidase